jgi:hypothetical protein
VLTLFKRRSISQKYDFDQPEPQTKFVMFIH